MVGCNIAFFDDRYLHNTAPTTMPTYSIRVNGKFKPWVREYIGENYNF